MKETSIKQDGSGILFLEVSKQLGVLSYHSMAKKLKVDPGQISRVKNGQSSITDGLLCSILRACPKFTIKYIEQMIPK